MADSNKELSKGIRYSYRQLIRDVGIFLSDQAKQFAESYTKKNGHKPKILLCYCSVSKNSKHLMRQIRDAAQGWDVEFHVDFTQMTPPPGIYVYQHENMDNPNDVFAFWLKVFSDVQIDTRSGQFGPNMYGSEAVILINDPTYFQ